MQETFEWNGGYDELWQRWLQNERFTKGYIYELSDSVASGAVITDALTNLGFRVERFQKQMDGSARRNAFLTTPEVSAHLSFYAPNNRYSFTVIGKTEDAIDNAAESIRKVLPPLVIKDDGTLNVSFWADSSNGPFRTDRKILGTDWDEIKGNYNVHAAARLQEMMDVTPPFTSGRLALFVGAPGGGKTTVIRALAQKWKPWADISYIVDPEAFFGSAAYLLQVLLQSREEVTYEPNPGEVSYPIQDRWRLLVVEDADEFLRMDAKQRSGQALSRLLNTADGLIGQGLQILTLISTNEKLDDIHPAVSRKGRCFANIEFHPLTPDEAAAWMKRQGVEGWKKREATLAELYDELRSLQQIATDKPALSSGLYV